MIENQHLQPPAPVATLIQLFFLTQTSKQALTVTYIKIVTEQSLDDLSLIK